MQLSAIATWPGFYSKCVLKVRERAGMVVYPCNPRTQKAEAGRSRVLKPA
jgi:hypothetical protein